MKKSLLLTLCFVHLGLILSKTLEKDIVILYKEEKINNNNFAQKIQSVNGSRKIIYLVNGQPVEWEEYQEQLLESEKQERKIELEKDLETRLKFCDLQQRIKNKISQSTLLDIVLGLSTQLNKILENKLKPYWAFSKETIESRELLENLYQEFLPEARELANLNAKDIDFDKINKTINQAKDYLSRLQNFFTNTIDNAVENSDDTKMLKELLELTN